MCARSLSATSDKNSIDRGLSHVYEKKGKFNKSSAYINVRYKIIGFSHH